MNKAITGDLSAKSAATMTKETKTAMKELQKVTSSESFGKTIETGTNFVTGSLGEVCKETTKSRNNLKKNMGEKIQKIKSAKFRAIKINRNLLYQTLISVFILFLSLGGFQVLKECCLETKRTFAIITSDYRSKRAYKREFTFEYQVDGERYKGKIVYSGESIASVGDTCYVIYEVRNKENARVVCSRFWGYGDSPVIVKKVIK